MKTVTFPSLLLALTTGSGNAFTAFSASARSAVRAESASALGVSYIRNMDYDYAEMYSQDNANMQETTTAAAAATTTTSFDTMQEDQIAAAYRYLADVSSATTSSNGKGTIFFEDPTVMDVLHTAGCHVANAAGFVM
jgi:hypothetical protein